MKYTLHILILTLLIAVGSTVRAEDASASPQMPPSSFMQTLRDRLMGKPEIKTDLKVTMMNNRATTTENRRNATTTIQNIRQEMEKGMKDKMDKQRNDLLRGPKNRFSVMIEHFDTTITRLQDILARLDSRTVKIKSDGGDTSKSDVFVSQAHLDITAAQTSFLSFSTLASSTDMTLVRTFGRDDIHASATAGIATSTLSQLRKMSDETTKHIRDAQKDMEKAVGLLQGLKIGQDMHTEAASTTHI